MRELLELSEFEQAITTLVMKRMTEAGINVVFHDCRQDDDDYFSLTLGVEPGTVDEAWDKMKDQNLNSIEVHGRNAMVSISFEPRVPPLVHASLGDWVLIYTRWRDMDEWNVGKVTSIRKSGDVVAYGVRYVHDNVKLGLGGAEVFEISGEDYGGNPEGFVKVLDEKEALDIIERQVRQAYKKNVNRLEGCMATLRRDVAMRAKAFSNRVDMQEIWAEPLKPHRPQDT
jgi:hypothetical protein